MYFSDVLQGGVRRWSDGGVEDVLPKRRGIGGMCLHADGGLVVSGRDVIHEQRVLLGEIDGVTGFNDLAADSEGRVYVGALRFKPFAGETPKPGQVWRVDGAGSATPVLEGIDWPNGIGFSPNGETMYACDYAHGTVLTSDGVFARSPAGSADGLAVDETVGYGWRWGRVARSRASARRLSDRTFDVPADFVSSLCFGGDDMRDVYVTTIGALLHGRSDVPGLPVPPATI